MSTVKTSLSLSLSFSLSLSPKHTHAYSHLTPTLPQLAIFCWVNAETQTEEKLSYQGWTYWHCHLSPSRPCALCTCWWKNQALCPMQRPDKFALSATDMSVLHLCGRIWKDGCSSLTSVFCCVFFWTFSQNHLSNKLTCQNFVQHWILCPITTPAQSVFASPEQNPDSDSVCFLFCFCHLLTNAVLQQADIPAKWTLPDSPQIRFLPVLGWTAWGICVCVCVLLLLLLFFGGWVWLCLVVEILLLCWMLNPFNAKCESQVSYRYSSSRITPGTRDHGVWNGCSPTGATDTLVSISSINMNYTDNKFSPCQWSTLKSTQSRNKYCSHGPSQSTRDVLLTLWLL